LQKFSPARKSKPTAWALASGSNEFSFHRGASPPLSKKKRIGMGGKMSKAETMLTGTLKAIRLRGRLGRQKGGHCLVRRIPFASDRNEAPLGVQTHPLIGFERKCRKGSPPEKRTCLKQNVQQGGRDFEVEKEGTTRALLRRKRISTPAGWQRGNGVDGQGRQSHLIPTGEGP